MRRVEVATQRRAQQLTAHLVQLVHAVADGPDAHIHIAARADGGVGERQKLAGLVPSVEDGYERGLVRGFFVGGEATHSGMTL